MKYLAVQLNVQFLSSEFEKWSHFYDDGSMTERKRDNSISYAYQNNGFDCGLFVIVIADLFYYWQKSTHHHNEQNNNCNID